MLFQLKMNTWGNFTVTEVFTQLLDHEHDIEENVSEMEDNIGQNFEDDSYYDPDYEKKEEEVDSSVPPNVSQPQTLLSNNQTLIWSISPHEQQGRLSAANVI